MNEEIPNKIPLLSIVGIKSGTGKTTLIEKIIQILKSRNYKIGIIKHDVHQFEIDYPGKDTYIFTEAGADKVVIASNYKLAMIETLETPKTLEHIRGLFQDVHIVIVEGFKDNNFPKIEIHRKDISKQLLYNNDSFNISNFIAVASDEPLDIDIPVLDLNDVQCISNFIEDNFFNNI